MAARIEWTEKPNGLVANIRGYSDLVTVNTERVANSIAADGKKYMQNNAPWTDRTGRARRYLRGYVTKNKTKTIINFQHSDTVPYGVYLEFENGGRYAIITPTTRIYAEETMKRLREMFGG